MSEYVYDELKELEHLVWFWTRSIEDLKTDQRDLDLLIEESLATDLQILDAEIELQLVQKKLAALKNPIGDDTTPVDAAASSSSASS